MKSWELHVGATIWIFNGSRRVYRKGESAPIYREHFEAVTITGETGRSWVTRHGRKIPKRGTQPLDVYFSQAQIDDAVYVHDHGWRIADVLRRCHDANTLRQIADLLGYKLPPGVPREAT